MTASTMTAPNDRRLIDTIVYLASLVSDPHVIDPQLDTLRGITATFDTNKPLPERERKKLDGVQHALMDHLLHRDAVRRFTPETLHTKLTDQFGVSGEGPRHGHESLRRVGLVILASIVAYPVGVGLISLTNIPYANLFGSIFASSAIYLGLIWLYWSALPTFTPELRRAYKWICVNMAIISVGAATQPIFSAWPHLGNIPIFSYGALSPMFAALGFMVAYWGMRIFALGVGIRSRWTSLRFVGWVTAGIVGVAFVIPHVRVPVEWAFDLAMLTYLCIIWFGGLVAIIGFQIARRVTKLYGRAVGWMGVSYGQAAVTCTGALVMVAFTGPIYAGAKATAIGILFGTCVITLLLSGYWFSRSTGKS